MLWGKPGISGLLSNTVYHYRAVATNSEGAVSSPDQTFATLAEVGDRNGDGVIDEGELNAVLSNYWRIARGWQLPTQLVWAEAT